jgi:hypothetical protein
MIPAPYDDVYDAIVEYLGTPEVAGEWDQTLAPLYFENTLAGPPPGELGAFVKVVLDTQLYSQETIGAGEDNRWDEAGTLWFHIFTARGVDSREARRIGKALANAFRGRRMLDGDLEFQDADLGAGDPGAENSGYYLLSVSIDWYRTEAS